MKIIYNNDETKVTMSLEISNKNFLNFEYIIPKKQEKSSKYKNHFVNSRSCIMKEYNNYIKLDDKLFPSVLACINQYLCMYAL